jgi:hypothetical protein
MPNEAPRSGRRCPHCGKPPGLRWSALLPSNSRDRSFTCLACGGRYDTSDLSKMASIFGGLLGIGPGIYVLGILVKGHGGSALAVGAGTLVVVAAFAIASISFAWLTLRLEAQR